MGLQSWLIEKSQNHCRKSMHKHIPQFLAACRAMDGEIFPLYLSINPGLRPAQTVAQELYTLLSDKATAPLFAKEEALEILDYWMLYPDLIGETAWNGLRQLREAATTCRRRSTNCCE